MQRPYNLLMQNPWKTKPCHSFHRNTGSLSVVVRSYRSAVTNNAHKFDNGFYWQPGFYDNIICTTGQLKRIRKYVLDNPQNWNGNEWNLSSVKRQSFLRPIKSIPARIFNFYSDRQTNIFKIHPSLTTSKEGHNTIKWNSLPYPIPALFPANSLTL